MKKHFGHQPGHETLAAKNSNEKKEEKEPE